jgi:hypothetical protein
MPDHSPCAVLNPPITVQGDGFPPGLALDLTEGPADAPPGQANGTVGHAVVGLDGTFVVRGPLGSCAPPVPDGTRFVVEAVDPAAPAADGTLAVLARAIFTKATSGSPDAATEAAWAAVRAHVPQPVPVYRPTWLPERFRQTTPEFIDGAFLGVSYLNSADDYLQFSIGGANSAAPTSAEPLAVHGQAGFLTFSDGSPPIGVHWQEAGQSYGIRGGKNVTRAEILQVAESLAPVGADGAFAPQCFPETGRCAVGRFFAYWLAHGGLALNGYPLSNELDQQLEDGQTYTVQYFERTRLELHPENPAPTGARLSTTWRSSSRLMVLVPCPISPRMP